MANTLVELSNVTKSFGPVDVLMGVNFKVEEGKVTALVGDNGAGKSTLIKGLSGVQPHDGGTVSFAGQKLRQIAASGIVTGHRSGLPRTWPSAKTWTSWNTCSPGREEST